jgi:hypothetical protein
MIMRIAVIPERLGGVLSPCGTIRLSTFFDAVRNATHGRWEVRYLVAEEVEAFQPHIIVWQRVALPTSDDVAAVVKIAKAVGATMIYDLDDNLFELDDQFEKRMYAEKLEAVRASLQAADQVWCSTPNLAANSAGISRSPPLLMTNALDPGLWVTAGGPVLASGPVSRLLYMGTRTHAADLELLNEAMALLERRAPGRYKLDVVGVSSHYGEFPWLEVLAIPSHVGASYPAFVHWLCRQGARRLGVAPLLRSRFNDSKSNIKVLDYAALGMPALVSDVPAYSSLRADMDCMKSDNSAVAWATSIERACADEALTSRVLSSARSLIGERVFSNAVRLRMDAIDRGLSRV